MIERHITFTVLPDKADRFEQFFTDEYRPPMTAFPGFVRADLLRAAESTDRYQMVLRWDDGESAAGWRTSGVHEGLQPTLQSLVTGTEIQAYDVIA